MILLHVFILVILHPALILLVNLLGMIIILDILLSINSTHYPADASCICFSCCSSSSSTCHQQASRSSSSSHVCVSASCCSSLPQSLHDHLHDSWLLTPAAPQHHESLHHSQHQSSMIISLSLSCLSWWWWWCWCWWWCCSSSSSSSVVLGVSSDSASCINAHPDTLTSGIVVLFCCDCGSSSWLHLHPAATCLHGRSKNDGVVMLLATMHHVQ